MPSQSPRSRVLVSLAFGKLAETCSQYLTVSIPSKSGLSFSHDILTVKEAARYLRCLNPLEVGS